MTAPLTEKQRQQWKDKIQAQKQNGLSIEKWCRENQIIESRFYDWKKKLFPDETTPHFSNFIELKDPKKWKLSLDYQDMHLQLESTNLKKMLRLLDKITTCS